MAFDLVDDVEQRVATDEPLNVLPDQLCPVGHQMFANRIELLPHGIVLALAFN
jgi:hypothetical protein